MAIYPNLAFAHSSPASAYVEAWTEQVTQSLGVNSLSPPGNAGARSAPLAIPIEEEHGSKQRDETATHGDSPSSPYRPLRRDSLKRREALLKGKEGSRRRQRWENDRLMSNPWAQPPLPSDWEVHPTYPKHVVPYYLAPMWDANAAARQNAEKAKSEAARKRKVAAGESHGKVPKELREKLKKAKASKGLLQALEEEVRKFVKKWEEKTNMIDKEVPREIDSEDEEIVFIGRNGQMHDTPPSPRFKRHLDSNDVQSDQLVFDSLVDDHGASFGRWLVHSIASYYGLRTWSITVGDPARREAYVGIKQVAPSGRPVSPIGTLPQPLWGIV